MIRILLLVLLLASCGSDDESTSSSSGSSFWSFSATDPYIVNAIFFYDQNENGIYDQGELISSPTDTFGNGTFPSIIPAGGRIEQFQGGIMDGYNYLGKLKGISDGVSQTILSPLTTLNANGFSNDQILELLDNVGITIPEDQIYQDPMTDPELLKANLTVTQALLATTKGFDLSPSDMSTTTTFKEPYAQELFQNAALVYGQVITVDEFNTNLTNLSKMASSFLSYINKYGTDDFVVGGTPTEGIDKAKTAIENVIDYSTNSYQPVSLRRSENSFLANVVAYEWFDQGSYDFIGVNFINISTPIAKDTIGKYPFSPKRVKISLYPATVSGQTLSLPTIQNYQTNYTFNSDTNIVTLKTSLTQTDGDKTENSQWIKGLPISTYDEQSISNLRSAGNNEDIPINERNLRLVGDGQGILTYYGINWNPQTPTDKSQWTVDKSRTNNCLTKDIDPKPTTTCDPNTTIYYDSQKVNFGINSFSALTDAKELGPSPSTSTQAVFTVRKISLDNSSTSDPIEYKISQISLVEANLIIYSPCTNINGCFAVKVDGEETRLPLEETEDVSFFRGYDSFPSNYKVWAVNNILIKRGPEDSKICDTSGTSSFYKGKMLIVELPDQCVQNFQEIKYLFLDLATRVGVAGSEIYPWMEGSVEKFKYRNFNYVNLKQEILP